MHKPTFQLNNGVVILFSQHHFMLVFPRQIFVLRRYLMHSLDYLKNDAEGKSVMQCQFEVELEALTKPCTRSVLSLQNYRPFPQLPLKQCYC